MSVFRTMTFGVSLFFLASCTGLPNGGPTAKAILDSPPQTANSPERTADYTVVEVTRNVVQSLRDNTPRGFIGTFGSGWFAAASTIGIGDTVGVTIYESTNGGLFGSGDPAGIGTKSATLPPQQVDSSGRISVPFAGRVMAAGRSPAQVQTAIVNALAKKAIDPQAIVSVTQNASRFITVAGEVGQGGRFPVTENGNRILDAIAAAGGPRNAAYQIYVRLTRGSRSSVMKLDSLVSHPNENVHVAPGDQIFLYRTTQSFTVLGALARNANVEFDSEKLSLVEALGKANGLIDQRSDPRGVFVFRYESAATLRAVAPSKDRVLDGERNYSVVYHVDLRDAQGLFLSQAFSIRDKDIVYVSNAPATDLGKFLQLLGSGLGVAGGAVSTVTVIGQ